MSTTLLTDVQLMALYRHKGLDNAIYTAVKAEWERRGLVARQETDEQAQARQAVARLPLPTAYKLLLLLLPFFFPVLLALRSGMRRLYGKEKGPAGIVFLSILVQPFCNTFYIADALGRGAHRRWRAWWLYWCLGCLLWLLLLLIAAWYGFASGNTAHFR